MRSIIVVAVVLVLGTTASHAEEAPPVTLSRPVFDAVARFLASRPWAEVQGIMGEIVKADQESRQPKPPAPAPTSTPPDAAPPN